MEIRDNIEIGGLVEILTADLEIFTGVINKQASVKAKLNFKMKITTEIDGIEIEPFYTERLFELSQQTFDKLIEKGIIKMKE